MGSISLFLANSLDLLLPGKRDLSDFQLPNADGFSFIRDIFTGLFGKICLVGCNFTSLSVYVFNRASRNYHKVFQKPHHLFIIYHCDGFRYFCDVKLPSDLLSDLEL